MEPPGLEEEISGGGSGMVSGLTAESEGWPLCWNAAWDRSRGLGGVFSDPAAAHAASQALLAMRLLLTINASVAAFPLEFCKL